MVRALGAFAVFVALAAPAAAATNRAGVFPVAQIDVPPGTADLATGPWANATVVNNLENLTTRAPANQLPTTARILFDRANIYVAIHAVQTGVPLVRTQTTNDIGFGVDDYVGVGIDTTGNGQAYFFETTPSGVRYQQSTESVRYRPVWVASAHETPDGWDALLAVPFSVLRTEKSPVQKWRVNIIRHIASRNENQTWAYDPIMSDGGGFPSLSDARYWPALDGVHVGSNANRPRPRAEIFGLESFGQDRDRYQQATGAFAPQGTRHVGFDANVPLTGTISFVGALAPDFSNVEVDQQTISPQEFRRGLSEYRPFFSQGANFFSPVSSSSINQAPNQLFYSPGIGPFDRGEKIEGTYGLQSIGLLNVAGAGFNDTVLGFKHALGDRTFSYSFDAVSAHHANGNLTASPFQASDFTYDAMVAGRNLKTGLVYTADYGAERGSVAGTTPRLAYRSENFLDVHKSNYEIFTSYRDIGPKWNPIDGFTNVADIRGPGSFVDLNSTPGGGGPFKRLDFFVFGDRLVDRSGAAHQSDAFANATVVFKNLLSISGGPSTSALRLYDSGASLVGYDGGYRHPVTVPFNSHNVSVGYRDGTPTPYDASYSWGPFATFDASGLPRNTYLQQYSVSSSRPLGSKYTIGAEVDGTLEEFPTADPRVRTHDGQILRRFSFGQALGNESNLSLSLRSVSGNGGFGTPGLNLAGSYHRRFANASELFINYGTPAANSTLQRVIVKYVLRLGGGAGT